MDTENKDNLYAMIYFKSRKQKFGKNARITWAELCKRLKNARRTKETMAEFQKMSKEEQADIKDVGGFIAGHSWDNQRQKGSIDYRSMLTLDMDECLAETPEQLKQLPVALTYYSTHKSTPEHPRLRLIVPLARDVSPEEYEAVARKVAEEIGIDQFDDSTYEPNRMMFWQSTPSDGEYLFFEKDGELLDPDEYLAKYEDWGDISQWPVSSRQKQLQTIGSAPAVDPLEKPGLIGAFNREYPISMAIEEFLSDVYVPSAVTGRYDYTRADSSAGLVITDDKLAHSFHATDPAYGKTLCAFDLVRVHKFGPLDENEPPDTPFGELPSQMAMMDLAREHTHFVPKLPNIKRRKANQVLQKDWKKELKCNEDGKALPTLQNFRIIFNNDPAFEHIVYNEFKDMIDIIGEVPWNRPHNSPWRDSDFDCLQEYVETQYDFYYPKKIETALNATLHTDHRYHPVKNYLSGLKWDGIERVDTLLIDYLGAEDHPYTRAVTRKTLAGAVARIYEPGIKFDHMLVLNGPQGIGKSTLFSRLAKNWFSDALAVYDMKDKTAAEKVAGYWIQEISELNGMRKMEIETIKSFISRTDDVYRVPYEKKATSHFRSCIIVGTTNNMDGFLRDVTGNRRFWPVSVPGGSEQHTWELTDVVIDQIWAEAVEYYKGGEPLHLTGEEAVYAEAMQREAMESSELEGMIQVYLDKLLPDNWICMNLMERRNFLNGNSREKGVMRRDHVSVVEIWCECFDRERDTVKKGSAEITMALTRLNWKPHVTKKGKIGGKLNMGLFYGVQKAFDRPVLDNGLEEDTASLKCNK